MEQKQTLGEYLKTERERRGLSLEQVSSVTKIGVRVLQSLEQDRYSELPALPFVKGFIKTYCQLLQLDPAIVLSDYGDFLKEKSKSRPNREGGMSGYAFERPEGEQAKRVLWIVMGAMFVFGALVVLVFKPSLKHRKHGAVAKLQASPSPSLSVLPSPSGSVAIAVAGASPLPSEVPGASPSPSPSIVVAAVSPSPVASPSPSVAALQAPATPLVLVAPSPAAPSPAPAVAVAPPSPVPSPSPVATVAAQPSPSPSATGDSLKQDPLQTGIEYPPAEIKYKVVVRALADVWVRYRCDEKKPMRFILKTGRILVLRGKNTVRFQVSNTDAVNISASGRNYRPLSTHPGIFNFLDTPTLVWPADAQAEIGQSFGVRGALPSTPDPAPEAPAGGSPEVESGADEEASAEG